MSPRTAPGEELRLELVEAASEILTAEGIGALSTRRVARAVGRSTTAIYSVFGSKEELVRGIFREGFARLERAQTEVPVTDDPLADLLELGRAYRRNALTSPHFYRVMFGQPVSGFEPNDEDIPHCLSALQPLAETVQRCLDSGVFDPADQLEITHQLWALVHGLTSLELRGMLGDEERAERLLEQGLHAATVGYARHAEG